MYKAIIKVKEAVKGVNRIGLVAILIAGAMAFSFRADKPSKLVAGTWGVNQMTVSGQVRYYLSEEISGQTKGIDFNCSNTSNACRITTTAATPISSDGTGNYVQPSSTGVNVVDFGTYVPL